MYMRFQNCGNGLSNPIGHLSPTHPMCFRLLMVYRTPEKIVAELKNAIFLQSHIINSPLCFVTNLLSTQKT